MSGAEQLALQLTLAAGAVTAGLYLIRVLWRALRLIGVMHDIVTRELEHNHGSSIKDDVYGTAVALGQTQRRLDEVERRLEAHLTRQDKER